ncbi:MAG: NAD-dependent epimerase/dehydratase family protein [Flavobacteriales bacterium]|nr:NAD-dependent epimerase/dehydratase family protein [Flavobacteriales bacterium]
MGNKSSILIFGSSGFIGSNAMHLLSPYYSCFGVDIQESEQTINSDFFYNEIKKVNPDFILFAAGSANVLRSKTEPEYDRKKNVTELEELLKAIVQSGQKIKLIHISSAAVYGNPERLPIEESSPTHPISNYGKHKLESEELVRHYHSAFQIPSIILRPFSVYGPPQKKLLFYDIYLKSKTQKSITLYGTGHESRDFIFIHDFITALHLIMQKGDFSSSIYNIASGTETSIREVASHFESLFPSHPVIQFGGESRGIDPENWRADISKLRAIGFVPSYNLKDGMQLYYDWLQKTEES